jgi:high-affinity Fe2+/Pb2+ permease
MDYSSLIIAAAIAVYGIWEYRRRERQHRIDIEFLMRGIEPPPETDLKVPRWRIATVAITACIAGGAAAVVIYKGATHPGYRAPLIIIGCIFLSLAAPLVYIIVRDIRLPRGKLRRSL